MEDAVVQFRLDLFRLRQGDSELFQFAEGIHSCPALQSLMYGPENSPEMDGEFASGFIEWCRKVLSLTKGSLVQLGPTAGPDPEACVGGIPAACEFLGPA